jgi:hypothetical protein
MLVSPLDDIRSFLDGRRFLKDSPFRSGYFWVVSAMGLAAILVDAYILYRHWQSLNVFVAILLGVPIGAQLIYQWLRTLRYYSRVRELYLRKSDEEAQDGSPLDSALRIAAGGLTDLLFYCYGMTLVALILVGALLTRLDGVR